MRNFFFWNFLLGEIIFLELYIFWKSMFFFGFLGVRIIFKNIFWVKFWRNICVLVGFFGEYIFLEIYFLGNIFLGGKYIFRWNIFLVNFFVWEIFLG